jgi:ABC-2 type transport system ATP-binding protein
MEKTAISLTNLSASYGNNTRKITALRNVQLEIKTGEIFGLLGPNGAGKTTLLSCVEGIHPDFEGEIRIGGLNIRTHARQAKQMLGIQLQRTSLLDYMTVSELVAVYAALYEVYLNAKQITHLLEQFGLEDLHNRLARRLSGGQIQRLSLTLAVANDPKIVLLDEPTEALDPHARRNIWQMIGKLHEEGRTIILTTHSMEEAESLCGRVAIIDQGEVIACDSPAHLVGSLRINPVLKTNLELPLEKARALPGAQASRYSGQYLEIETSQPQETLSALQQWAVASGNGIGEISLRQPNLEDVFLKLTGRQLTT